MLIEGKGGQEEVHWVSRAEDGNTRRAAARVLAQSEEERSLQVWMRVVLGEERRIDVAREYGYSDGSAVTHRLKRLQCAAQTDPSLRKRMAFLQAQHNEQMA